MITGKELEKIANENCKTVRIGCHKDESGYDYSDTQDVYDWQAIANELNQRTCETCAWKKENVEREDSLSKAMWCMETINFGTAWDGDDGETRVIGYCSFYAPFKSYTNEEKKQVREEGYKRLKKLIGRGNEL